MAAYMQEKFRFYGIPGELRKQVLRTYASSAPVLTDDQKREVIVNLWRQLKHVNSIIVRRSLPFAGSVTHGQQI